MFLYLEFCISRNDSKRLKCGRSFKPHKYVFDLKKNDQIFKINKSKALFYKQIIIKYGCFLFAINCMNIPVMRECTSDFRQCKCTLYKFFEFAHVRINIFGSMLQL